MNNINNIKRTISNTFDNAEIAKCAEKVLQDLKVNLDKPVPIINILNKMDIKTFQKEMHPDDLSAYISINPEYKLRFGSTKIACVNSLDNYGHKRFALAHELAHYLFDYDDTKQAVYYNTYMAGRKDEDDIEKRASFFAACILMPEKVFVDEYSRMLEKNNASIPDTIASLAVRFGVSTKAIQKRLTEVNIVG